MNTCSLLRSRSRGLPVAALRIAAASFVLAHAATAASAQDPLWLEQFGTSAADTLNGAAADGAGGTYAGGGSAGSLGGPNAGTTDAWLARYDATGTRIWIRQLGGSAFEDVFDVAANGTSGAFVCGETWSALGGTQAGMNDAWLARFDGGGHPIWLKQLGTSGQDRALAVASDGSGGVYVSGSTEGELGGPNAGITDAWLARYDGAGNQLWIRQLGTLHHDFAYVAAPDAAGGVYVGGRTDLDLGGPWAGLMDAWIARFDGAGTQLWIRQLGTSGSDIALSGVADGAGGVYVGGETTGSLGGPNAGFGDAWVARIDATGNELWIRQLGTNLTDGVTALAPDSSGGVFLTGATQGSLAAPNAGFGDAFLASYDAAGNALALHQLGTPQPDHPQAAAPDGAGGVVVGGFTEGSLGGPSAGGRDAWLMRFGECGATVPYCNASATSIAGCQAALSTSGSPSVGNPGGFSIASGDVPGGNLGICFFGDDGAAHIPFGTLGGAICVQPPFFRTGPAPSGGSTGQCDGDYVFGLQALIDASPIVLPGATLHAQIWARDPANADGFLLSDAMVVIVCP